MPKSCLFVEAFDGKVPMPLFIGKAMRSNTRSVAEVEYM